MVDEIEVAGTAAEQAGAQQPATGGGTPGQQQAPADQQPNAEPRREPTNYIEARDFRGLPEKHRVMKPDGTLDAESTLWSLETQRAALERRIGPGDIRPKEATGYKLELPEGLRPLAATLPEEGIRAFQQEAHDMGLSQPQYLKIMEKYLTIAPQLAQGFIQHDMETAVAELQQSWPVEADYKRNIARAQLAIRSFGGDDAAGIVKDYGNDPRIARMMARVGAETGEDRAPQMAGSSPHPSVESLELSEAYRDPKHADHARVSAQVRDFYIHQRQREERT